jgi:hypothetical protein
MRVKAYKASQHLPRSFVDPLSYLCYESVGTWQLFLHIRPAFGVRLFVYCGKLTLTVPACTMLFTSGVLCFVESFLETDRSHVDIRPLPVLTRPHRLPFGGDEVNPPGSRAGT